MSLDVKEYVMEYKKIVDEMKEIDIEDKSKEIDEKTLNLEKKEKQNADLYGNTSDRKAGEMLTYDLVKEYGEEQDEINKLREKQEKLEENRKKVSELENKRDELKKIVKLEYYKNKADINKEIERLNADHLIDNKRKKIEELEKQKEQEWERIQEDVENGKYPNLEEYKSLEKEIELENKSIEFWESQNKYYKELLKSLNSEYQSILQNFIRIDEEVTFKSSSATTKLEEQLNKDWEDAIKENEEFDKRKAEEQLNKDWEDAIKENEEFDKRKAEEQLNEDWDAAIKENEEFDRRKQNEIAWNKAIKEYEELERKTNEQGENSVRRTYQQGSGNRGSVSNSLEKVKITLMVDKNKVDIDEAGDLFYKEARNNGKKLRNELDKNNLFYKDKKGMKNIDYALLYAIKEVNSDLVQDYLNVIKGKAVGKDRYEESKKRLTEALDIEYKFDEGRGLFRGFKEKRVARNAKKLGIASLEGISEKSVLDKIKESFNKFKNINLLKGKEKQKALGDGKKTNAQIQKETAINLCEKDGFRQGLKVDKDKLKREKNVNSVEETLAKNVTEIMKEENNGEER